MSGISGELPYEAIGSACGVFVYSSICLAASSMLLWAALAHREWKSYVALLAFFTSLSTLASMAQQLHTYLRWTSIKIEQSDYVKANIDNPELSIAGASVGADLVLFYIQFYCYNVESILVASWCIQLAHSVYRLKASRSTSRYGSNAAKTTAILLPVLQVSLMRTEVLQSHRAAFYFVANVIMGVSFTIGLVLLLAILGKYVATKAETSWHVQYGSRTTAVEDEEAGHVPSAGNDSNLASLTDSDVLPLYRKSIYDNWLVVRFTIAFAGLAAFQLIVILQEITFAMENDLINNDEIVNLEPNHAIADTQSFAPGVSASMLAFIVFGTTKAFRDFFYVNLVPRSIRRRFRAKSKRPSVANAAVPLPAQARGPARRESEIPGGLGSPAIVGPLSGRSECFELEGGEVGRHPGMGTAYELATPTPTHSVFELQKKGDDEDKWPILSIRPHQK